MNLNAHLAHLVALLHPEYAQGWKAYVWQRAKELSSQPELADLPRLLTEEMRVKVTCTTSTDAP